MLRGVDESPRACDPASTRAWCHYLSKVILSRCDVEIQNQVVSSMASLQSDPCTNYYMVHLFRPLVCAAARSVSLTMASVAASASSNGWRGRIVHTPRYQRKWDISGSRMIAQAIKTQGKWNKY